MEKKSDQTPQDNQPAGAPGQVFTPAAGDMHNAAQPAVDTTALPPEPSEPAAPTPSEPAPAALDTSTLTATDGAEAPLPADPTRTPAVVYAPSAGSIVDGKAANTSDTTAENRRRLPGKKIMLPVIAVLVLLGGSAGAYFGYYMPNKPENVWKTALTRTGQGYDKLSQYAVTQFKSQNSGLDLNGNFKTTGFLAADGTFSGKSDKDNGEFTGSLSTSGLKINLDVRTLKSSTDTPDIYVKIDGVQGIGDTLGGFLGPQYVKALNGINGQWYFIDHSLFDQLAGSSGNNLQITSDDVSSVLNAVGNASKQNVFTNDPNKMVFTVKKYVGKEKQDNRSVYHYVAGINKANLKTYLNNLCTNLKNSNLKKFFNNDSQQVSDTLGCSNASTAIDNFDTNRTADVWVDLHTKLVHKVRFTDTKNNKNYFDISQDYQGGNQFPFAMNFHSSDQGLTNDSSLNLVLDTKANSLSLNGSTKDTGSDNLTGNLQLMLKPNNSKVDVKKPDGAKTIIQLLNDLGLSDAFSQGSADTQTQAKDTERRTDINALTAQLEVYYADNGNYPTLAQLNDATWRSANLKGSDPSAFKDPDGASGNLAAAPAVHVYAYQALPAGCDNKAVQCNDYTLTATLDGGGTVVKHSLNSETNLPAITQ